MKKKHFEWFLSQIETFQNFKVQLEQYSTSVELAEAILNAIAEEGCIDGCAVADLGCGPGMLLLGAIKLGASYGLGVEIDEEAINICQSNIEHCDLANNIDVICLDVTKNISALKPIFDTVIMNPPFGTKNNAGIDLRFVRAGLSILKKTENFSRCIKVVQGHIFLNSSFENYLISMLHASHNYAGIYPQHMLIINDNP